MIGNKISVIIPVVRPEKAKRCVDSIRLHCPGVEIITEVDTEGIGCPMMVEKLTSRTTRQIVVFLGDDTIVTKDSFQKAFYAMQKLPDGWGVVGFNTTPGNDHAHWMADKRILDLIPGGNFFSTEYEHSYGDDEIKDIAMDFGRWAYDPGAIIEHDHPVNGGDNDEFYEKAYGTGKIDRDRSTYIRRKRERYGNKIGIGFPLIDPTVPVQFFTSFACMDKPDTYTLLVPRFPHGHFGWSIADARNSLVEQAQMQGVKHLLMLDTDQVYPHDTLSKLLSHGKEICGVMVHTRWVPFKPVLLRGELGKYKSVSETEMYSGDLIEVDATGTGCLLFDMQIGDKIDGKWFEFSMVDGKQVGEDINFCSKARAIGSRIFVDTSIEVGHLITMEVNKTLHKMCKALAQKT